MTQSLRRFARLAIALMLPLLPMLISPPGSHAQAQAGGQAAEELIVHHDGVVHVKDLPPAAPDAPVYQVIPRKFPHPELLRQKKEEFLQRRQETQPTPESPLRFEAPVIASSLTASTGFIGLRFSDTAGFIPPDTQVAAGPNHLFEVVNTEGRIFMKDGTVLSTFNLNTFFGLSRSTFLSDPKIRFDPMTGHWFISAITLGNSSGAWRLAVSRSSDPFDGFFLYSIITSGAGPDFDALGFNDDKVVLTANAFNCVPNCVNGSTFLGAMFIVLKKDDLLAGSSTPKFQFFAPDLALNTIQPAHSLSSTTTLFMAAADSGSATSIRIWSLTGVPDGTGGGVTSTTTDLAINTLSTPPPAAQKDTLTPIETNDNDLLDAVFRDDSLWVAANSACTPSGDTNPRACLRFIQIDTTGSMAVQQDFDFGTTGGYYYYPAIQTDSANNLLTVFSKSSASEFASVYASGRLTSDTLNTLQTPVLIHAGEAAYQPFADRWGDYSGAGIDPSDLASVWVAGEYARMEGGSEWGTWIAKIGLGASGFTLSAIKAGNGTGTVTISTPATTCDSTCAGTSLHYSSSTSISLTATGDATAIFTDWSGDPDCTSTNPIINFTINANMACTATFVTAPDLTGQIVSLTRKTSHGMDKLKFTLAIQNIGTAPVIGSFVVKFFLSNDQNLDDPGDTLLVQTTVSGRKLTPGKTISVKGSATVPSPSMGKYVIGFIDATDVIPELSETNNTSFQQIP